MKKSEQLSKTMLDAIAFVRQHNGIQRYKGGYWARPGLQAWAQGEPFFGAQTMQALVDRGILAEMTPGNTSVSVVLLQLTDLGKSTPAPAEGPSIEPRSTSSLAALLRAASFAATAHTGQTRKSEGDAPIAYINHPLAVASVLADAGVDDLGVLMAACLHDVIEDTDVTEADLRKEFGNQVAEIVLEVTDDKSLPKQERKRLQVEHAPSMSRSAKLVKLADKVCNLRDLLEAPPPWPRERKAEYFEWASHVVMGCRGVNARLEVIFDDLYERGRASYA